MRYFKIIFLIMGLSFFAFEGKSQNHLDYGSGAFKQDQYYSLQDTLAFDFNGDQTIDTIWFVSDSINSGIVIKYGHSSSETRIGFGKQFYHIDNFMWVDFWGITFEKETYEIIVENGEIVGDQTIELENPAIIVEKLEAGGGLITYKNGEIIWVHHSD